MDNSAVKRPVHLEDILARANKPRHEPEVEEAALKEARLAIPTPMLDVVFRDGRIRSFSYAYLKEVGFAPGDTVTLKYADGVEVIVEGRALAYPRQQVRLHRAAEIRECSESELALEREGASQVEKITITEGERG